MRPGRVPAYSPSGSVRPDQPRDPERECETCRIGNLLLCCCSESASVNLQLLRRLCPAARGVREGRRSRAHRAAPEGGNSWLLSSRRRDVFRGLRQEETRKKQKTE